MTNNIYSQLKASITAHISNNVFTLQDGDISSTAVTHLFKTILGSQKLQINLADTLPDYCPVIPTNADTNALGRYLNQHKTSQPPPTNNPWFDDDNQSVGLIGIGQNPMFQDMLIVAIFSVKNHGSGQEIAHLYLQAIPSKDNWSLADSFGYFKSAGIIAQMQFVQSYPDFPTLHLSSYQILPTQDEKFSTIPILKLAFWAVHF